MATNLRPLIEDRIRLKVPAFKEVAGASDLASLLAGRLTDHGCYLFKEGDSATGNHLVGATAQRKALAFTLIIVIRNVKDARGADADDISHGLQDSVEAALLGWSPDGNADPLEYSNGKLLSFANGFHIYKKTFNTYQSIRATNLGI